MKTTLAKQTILAKQHSTVIAPSATLAKLGITDIVQLHPGYRFAEDGEHARPCYGAGDVAKEVAAAIEPCAKGCECGKGGSALDAILDDLRPLEAVAAPSVDAPIATPTAARAPSPIDDSTCGVVVVDDGATAGAMVWWRLSGTTDVAKVRDAFAAAGLPEDEVLDEPSSAAALAAAVRAQRSNRMLARPLPSGDGWALVQEVADERANNLDWSTALKIQRLDDGRLVFNADGSAAPGTFAATREQIAADYAAALEAQSTGKVGAWLTKLARRSCDATGLRENGGVYFIPQPKVAAWKERVAAVRAAHGGHTFALVPAMRTEDAVAAVVDALTAEAGNEAGTLEAEVMAGDLTARSLETRAERTKALAEKVERYGKLMGQRMPEVAARLEQLQATIAAARLVAQAEEGK